MVCPSHQVRGGRSFGPLVWVTLSRGQATMCFGRRRGDDGRDVVPHVCGASDGTRGGDTSCTACG
eukprot:12303428-Prorocentrum_lima.AAC.1